MTALDAPTPETLARGRFKGKTALITGAARGLGAAAAARFAQEGAIVYVADIAEDEGLDLVEGLRAQGGRAFFQLLDVADEVHWRAIVSEIDRAHGRIDVLVNNAGVALPTIPIEDRTVEDWDRVMTINVRGVFLGVKHVIPIMRRSGDGSIVNISSAAALGQWQIQDGAYAASKAAVRVFTKTVAAQNAASGIRCNSVHPGPIDTDMVQAILAKDSAMLARRLSRVPMSRLGAAEEVVAAVLFLASDEASYITGAELAIDGGAVVQ